MPMLSCGRLHSQQQLACKGRRRSSGIVGRRANSSLLCRYNARMKALTSRIISFLSENIKKSTAATKACALGTRVENQSWKAGLTDQSSFGDIAAAAANINVAGLSLHFKQLKKELSSTDKIEKNVKEQLPESSSHLHTQYQNFCGSQGGGLSLRRTNKRDSPFLEHCVLIRTLVVQRQPWSVWRALARMRNGGVRHCLWQPQQQQHQLSPCWCH